MGGPMNVYEEEKYPFLAEEDIFIKNIIGAEIPFLGVCLGAQLLAKACGGKVYKAEQEEIGWFNIRLTNLSKNDPVFSKTSNNLEVFQMHGDTFDVPKNAFLLAEGDVVKNQAFRVGKNAYGFQFHVEVNGEILSEWFKNDEIKRKEYYNRYNEIQVRYNDAAKKIYENFFKLIKE